MKRIALFLMAVLLLLSGLALLGLSNLGALPLGRPYIYEYSAQMPEVDPVTAFVGATVVTMDGEELLSGQTLVVRDGVIAEIGEAGRVEVPAGAREIDASGMYLMPGLVDMHVHLQEENDLLLFAAHGVTSVRNMWGSTGISRAFGAPDQLELREQVKQGELLGPTIYTAGPVMEGDPPTTPIMPVVRSAQEARESVARQAAQGYDFVKVYDNLDEATYRAILQAAGEMGLPVIGHAPRAVGLEAVLRGGQETIEHLSGMVDPDAGALLVPEVELVQYAELTRQAGVWNVPTLGVYLKHVADEDLQAVGSRPEMGYVSPRMKLMWRYMFRPGAMQNITYQGDYPARISALNRQVLAALHHQGAGILAGTDTSNPYLVPGASLLDELELLVHAGLTPYEALRAATADAAQALGREDEFGRLVPGMRADLLQLEGNPLEDISAVRRQAGVMVHGRWLERGEVGAMLIGLKEAYLPTLVERLWPLVLVGLGVVVLYRMHRMKRMGGTR